MDVDTALETYVFETENSSADPVDVIIRGRNRGGEELYYRVALTDSEGEQILLRRNHHYKININGVLRYGVPTFGEALDTPATNNIWLSISDEVKSVQNNNYKLTVNQTSVVNNAADITSSDYAIRLAFNVETFGSNVIDESLLEVSWVEGDQLVSSTHNNELQVGVAGSHLSFDTVSGLGSITLHLNPMPADKDVLEGTILVKYGQLQRKIKVVTVRTQSFVPTWISSQVYGTTGETNASRSNVTLMFTIDENCPEELFPLRVLISSNELDVRDNVGQVLPVVRRGQDGYGIVGKLNTFGGVDIYEQGYKYVLEVDKPGKQYVYMWNILSQNESALSYVTIEAQNFHTLTKAVTYTTHNRAITVGNVETSASATGNDADKVYYMYVPPKKGAIVPLRMELKNSKTGEDVAYGEQDEFLLYSKFLSHFEDSDYSRVRDLLPDDPWMTNAHGLQVAHDYFPCQFLPVDESGWGTGGRVYGFTARKTYVDLFHEKANDDHHKSHFSLYMHTNRAASAEMIRISSNDLNSKAAFTTTTTTTTEGFTNTGIYIPNADPSYLYKHKATAESPVYTYRSMIFELRNYPAFRFNAQVGGVPTYAEAPNLTNDEEDLTQIDIDYGTNIDVPVNFDVKGYMYDASTEVNPFGQEFNIYIDAPTLKLKAGESDVVPDPNKAGRFVYTVAADATDHSVSVDFVTAVPVSAEEITVSSNLEEVIFKSKSFVLENIPIRGVVTYAESSSATPVAVPADKFISFTRVLNGSRIGSMNVQANGVYQLRLRKEYDFTWDGVGDKVKLYASIDGKYYSAIFDNLKALSQSPNITLLLEE